MTGRGLRRYLDDLLRGERPRDFAATDDDVAELRTAITLQGARPGADEPRAEFVAELERRLAESTVTPGTGSSATGIHRRVPRRIGRRTMLAGAAAIAAVSAALGVLIDRFLVGGRGGSDNAPPEAPQPETLSPVRGTWRDVAASAEVPEGAARAFEVGGVIGVVHRINGIVHGVTRVCTHQGCLLILNSSAARLDCPCHRTSFALSGQVITHQLPVAPAVLPALEAREVGGVIQVLAPR